MPVIPIRTGWGSFDVNTVRSFIRADAPGVTDNPVITIDVSAGGVGGVAAAIVGDVFVKINGAKTVEP